MDNYDSDEIKTWGWLRRRPEDMDQCVLISDEYSFIA